MNAIICDKCGRIFPKDGKYHAVCIDNYLAIMEPRINGAYHLCDECLDRLKEWMEEDIALPDAD